MDRITVVTPSIPGRHEMLTRAMYSVATQTHPAHAHSIAFDVDRTEGAWGCRTRAMEAARTEWIAFLDDDDTFHTFHLERCVAAQKESGADIIVPWFQVVGGSDPFPACRGVQVDPDPTAGMPAFGITCLVRRSIVAENDLKFVDRKYTGTPEDYHFWLQCRQAGATFHSIPDETWAYYHHGLNTSGLPLS
jgi:glycosyltransferase involved in cell wall biosynthesis